MIREAIGNKFKTFYPGDYGIEIETESKHAYNVPSGFFWDVPRYEAGHPNAGEPKPEQSLRDFGQEYVLRVPVPYEQVSEALAEFQSMMKDKKLITDSISTSVHIHKNILNEKFQTAGNFLTLYTLVENLLMEYAGEFRKHNLFCLPICDTPATHNNIRDMFIGAAKYKYTNWFLDVNAVKYGALNLSSIGHYGSIEMRQLSGDPNIKRIQTWIDIIQSMVVFSRQNITPVDILSFYREKGTVFLYDVFGVNAGSLSLLSHPELIVRKRNLWYAGEIAYCIEEDKWKELDTFPDRPKLTQEDLDIGASYVFGRKYDGLKPAQRQHLEDWVFNNLDYVERVKKQNSSLTKKFAKKAVMPAGNLIDIYQPPNWDVLSQTTPDGQWPAVPEPQPLSNAAAELIFDEHTNELDEHIFDEFNEESPE